MLRPRPVWRANHIRGICKGRRIKVTTLAVWPSPCWAVMTACRLAGELITSRMAAAIPAHRSRRQSPTAHSTQTNPLAQHHPGRLPKPGGT